MIASGVEHLRQTLDESYQAVNRGLSDGSNPYLTMGPQGVPRVRTPKTDYDEQEYIPKRLSEKGLTPILQVLRETNAVTNFVGEFRHLNVNATASQLFKRPELLREGSSPAPGFEEVRADH